MRLAEKLKSVQVHKELKKQDQIQKYKQKLVDRLADEAMKPELQKTPAQIVER